MRQGGRSGQRRRTPPVISHVPPLPRVSRLHLPFASPRVPLLSVLPWLPLLPMSPPVAVLSASDTAACVLCCRNLAAATAAACVANVAIATAAVCAAAEAGVAMCVGGVALTARARVVAIVCGPDGVACVCVFACVGVV